MLIHFNLAKIIANIEGLRLIYKQIEADLNNYITVLDRN